ncbi:hypothetical protein BDW74DRAFT_73779 [Aspergillus multicolor]|uniref:uncharacterized protein n=1 Tax=Aspergillus multicolor TaxID=41759 RepID=UPI003CCE03A0
MGALIADQPHPSPISSPSKRLLDAVLFPSQKLFERPHFDPKGLHVLHIHLINHVPGHQLCIDKRVRLELGVDLLLAHVVRPQFSPRGLRNRRQNIIQRHQLRRNRNLLAVKSLWIDQCRSPKLANIIRINHRDNRIARKSSREISLPDQTRILTRYVRL